MTDLHAAAERLLDGSYGIDAEWLVSVGFEQDGDMFVIHSSASPAIRLCLNLKLSCPSCELWQSNNGRVEMVSVLMPEYRTDVWLLCRLLGIELKVSELKSDTAKWLDGIIEGETR